MSEVDLAPLADRKKDSWYDQPFSLADRENKIWDAVTDRRLFVALRRKPKYKRFVGPGEEMFQMLSWLHGEPEDPHDIVVADLLRWIGPSPKGEGLVLGVPVTLRLLLKVLETAPLKKIALWQATKLVDDPRSLAFGVKDRWRAVLMGHKEKKGDLPVFDLGSEPVLFD